jgi:hypothetical protein
VGDLSEGQDVSTSITRALHRGFLAIHFVEVKWYPLMYSNREEEKKQEVGGGGGGHSSVRSGLLFSPSTKGSHITSQQPAKKDEGVKKQSKAGAKLAFNSLLVSKMGSFHTSKAQGGAAPSEFDFDEVEDY